MTQLEMQEFAMTEARNLLGLGQLGEVYLAHRLFVMFLRVSGQLAANQSRASERSSHGEA
jgi:hypothetical protein